MLPPIAPACRGFACQVDGDVDSEEEEDEGMGDIDVEAVATIEV